MFDVEFDDGDVSAYQVNFTLEYMHASCDEQKFLIQLMAGIGIDNRSNARAVKKEDGLIKSSSGNKVPRKTMYSWIRLFVEWKNRMTSLLSLKYIKDYYAVQVGKYAVNDKIAEEPAYNWWVRPVLMRRDRIISKVKKAYQWWTRKYGIRVPISVEEAL